jgi:hypothetical protein
MVKTKKNQKNGYQIWHIKNQMRMKLKEKFNFINYLELNK